MSWPTGSVFGDETFRRGFVDTSAGQIHYRYRAGEGRPLILLHASPGSAATLLPLMARLDARRPLYAFDTMGNGDSAPPPPEMRQIAHFAGAAKEAIANLGIDNADYYGTHTGAHLAVELAVTAPDTVNSLIIDGMGLYTSEQSSNFQDEYCPRVEPDTQGSQLLWVWNFITRGYMSFPWFSRSGSTRTSVTLPEPEFLHVKAVEVLKALSTYRHSYLAAFSYPKKEMLSRLEVPCLVTVGKQDVLAPYFDDLVAATPHVRSAFIDEEDQPAHLDALAALIDDFLDSTVKATT